MCDDGAANHSSSNNVASHPLAALLCVQAGGRPRQCGPCPALTVESALLAGGQTERHSAGRASGVARLNRQGARPSRGGHGAASWRRRRSAGGRLWRPCSAAPGECRLWCCRRASLLFQFVSGRGSRRRNMAVGDITIKKLLMATWLRLQDHALHRDCTHDRGKWRRERAAAAGAATAGSAVASAGVDGCGGGSQPRRRRPPCSSVPGCAAHCRPSINRSHNMGPGTGQWSGVESVQLQMTKAPRWQPRCHDLAL